MHLKTPSQELSKKWFAIQKIITITAFILFGSESCYSQPVFLAKNDPIFIAIKGRAVSDLRQSAERTNPESEENKSVSEKIKTWPKEKQDQLQAFAEKSIKNYIDQTHQNVETFMLVFTVLARLEEQQLTVEYDLRVQYLGRNKYAAEFWEDGLKVNSETHALIGKTNPNDRRTVEETHADFQKSIEEGKLERYTKVMALLYTKEKDGLIVFCDPVQPMYDFIKDQE
jgi:hypothetical protein